MLPHFLQFNQAKMPPCATDRPLGTEFPNHLAVGVPACAGGRQTGPSPDEAWRPLLLLGLVLLCLAPRALMAWKLDGLCPDGVAYIRLAELLDQGQGRGEFLRLSGVNPLPLVLVVLHRLGLDWEVAGSLWGVLMGAAVVLPLFGWLRRQFDRRVALAGCFLYAIHNELIRWSPEVLRDPTFWFLFTLGLYLLWRAVTEVRLGLFLSAAGSDRAGLRNPFRGTAVVGPIGRVVGGALAGIAGQGRAPAWRSVHWLAWARCLPSRSPPCSCWASGVMGRRNCCTSGR